MRSSKLNNRLKKAFKEILNDPIHFFKFAAQGTDLTLRTYQRQVAAAITESVITNAGRSFVVMFPRQSGKNELQAQIEAYLMTL